MLLDRVPASVEAWAQIRAKANIRIVVGLRLVDSNCGFGLSTALMSRLGNLELKVDFDIYVIETKNNQEPLL